MATLQSFSVYDKKSQSFSRPFFSATKGEASRAFSDMINDTSHPLGKHPEDYSLYLVGNFNDKEGKLSSMSSIEISIGLDHIDSDYQLYLELKANKGVSE